MKLDIDEDTRVELKRLDAECTELHKHWWRAKAELRKRRLEAMPIKIGDVVLRTSRTTDFVHEVRVEAIDVNRLTDDFEWVWLQVVPRTKSGGWSKRRSGCSIIDIERKS